MKTAAGKQILRRARVAVALRRSDGRGPAARRRGGELFRAGISWTLAGMICGIAAGCHRAEMDVPEVLPVAEGTPVAISGSRAWEEVHQFVALGPRDAGTPGAARAAEYLWRRLQDLGVEAQIQEFRETSPRGETVFRNVLGRIAGRSSSILLLASHYDTKSGISPDFVGANDSGSSTGLLLELARALQEAAPHPWEIRLAFFDGEEAMVTYGPGDGFHGSEYLARTWEAEGILPRVRAMILLDMVGDRDLTITIPRNCTPELVALAFEAAHREEVRGRFRLYPRSITDDHTAFLRRGVPAVNLIDFEYGRTPGKNDFWHTPEDTLDKLSAENLEIVGRVVARMAAQLMNSADGMGTERQ